MRDGAVESASPLGRRRDIQGLRAVAVLTVAIDHAGFQVLSGGFVGVDVFFVISGFLITGLLLKEGRQGNISLRRFYSRRARRILPAATVVIVVTTVASLLLLGFVRAKAVVSDAVWSALFAANIKFGRDGTDYFLAELPPSPLQHYWSLAVEEQFYLVWPLALLLLLGLRGRARPAGRPPHRRLLLALAAVATTSFAYSVLLTSQNPTAAYFSTPARAWELAAGAAVAVASPHIARLPQALKAAMSWAGLAGILLSCLVYSPATAFPGYAVALPVAGSALVLAGGIGGARHGAGLLLNVHPLQLLGDWSYSFYLWHWPALLIAAGYLRRDLTRGEALGVLGIALVAAVATYYLVENPVRTSPQISRHVNVGLLLYPASIAVIAVTVGLTQAGVRDQAAAMADAPAIDVEQISRQTAQPLSKDPAVRAVQTSVYAARDRAPVPGELSPSLLQVGSSKVDTGGCHALSGDTTNKVCETGDVGSERTLVMLGDSHARAWIPAIEKAARREGWSVSYFIKLGCPAARVTPSAGSSTGRAGCDTWRSWAVDQIAAMSPDVAIVASDVPVALIHPSTGALVEDEEQQADIWDDAYAETLSALAETSGRVIALGDPPGLDADPGECLAGRGVTLADCAFPRGSRATRMNEATRAAAESAGVDFVDATRWFCAYDSCPAVIASFIAYRDDEHISVPYAKSLSEALGKALGL